MIDERLIISNVQVLYQATWEGTEDGKVMYRDMSFGPSNLLLIPDKLRAEIERYIRAYETIVTGLAAMEALDAAT